MLKAKNIVFQDEMGLTQLLAQTGAVCRKRKRNSHKVRRSLSCYGRDGICNTSPSLHCVHIRYITCMYCFHCETILAAMQQLPVSY